MLEPGFLLNRTYAIRRVLGSGAYGVVCEATASGTTAVYAIKQLKKLSPSPHLKDGSRTLSLESIITDYYTRKTSEPALREIALHGAVHNHDNVVTIHEVVEDADHVYMVMDYLQRRDLFHAITDLRWYIGQDALIRRIMLQLINVVNYCHQMGVYHCDLKPENILISDDGLTVKIADFGLATTRLRNLSYNTGSSFYMSPERLLRLDPAGFNSRFADIWALGIILLNLVCGRNPWKRANPHDDSSFRTFVHDRLFLMKIMPVSAEVNRFLLSLFNLAPSRRFGLFDFYQFVFATPTFSRPVLSAAHGPVHHPRKVLFPLSENSSIASSASSTAASPLLPPLDIKPASRKRGHHHHDAPSYASGLLTPPSSHDDDTCPFKKARIA